MEILKVKQLSKHYQDGGNLIKAVDEIDLNIEQGEFVSVVGSSGSGKTTLLNLIGGIDSPTSGEIIVDGTNLLSLNETERTIFRRRKVGFIFQSYNLVPVLNAWENIVLPIELDGRSVDDSYILDLMKVLKIDDRRNHLPSALSGGEQQRVAIARAIASNPSIILADEPTGNLDSENSDEVMHLLKTCVDNYGITLILITHNEDISNMSGRIVHLKDGKVV
ncbi:ABC transporter ATP-binding protein [Mycoplasmatota bacterium]|nr:ABC transporter ATP-binding protein [Mycoplasmatota bacterium]